MSHCENVMLKISRWSWLVVVWLVSCLVFPFNLSTVVLALFFLVLQLISGLSVCCEAMHQDEKVSDSSQLCFIDIVLIYWLLR